MKGYNNLINRDIKAYKNRINYDIKFINSINYNPKKCDKYPNKYPLKNLIRKFIMYQSKYESLGIVVII